MMNKLPKGWRIATTEEELEIIQHLHQATVKLLKEIASDLKVTVQHLNKTAAIIEDNLDKIG